MIEEAQQHFENGNFAAAEVLYRKMLEDEPDNPEVLFMLSLTRQGQDDLDEPVELLNHAIRVQPKNPSLHYSLGNLQLRRKKLTEAEQAFHTAVGIDPNFVAAQNGVALVELARGRFSAAEHALRKALKSDPENPQTLVNIGIALLEQNQAGDAVAFLQQAVSAEPGNPAAQLHLGRAFLAADNAGFAIKCFENALALQPGSVAILQLLGEAQFRSNQFQEALRTYRRLLSQGAETAANVAGLARSLMALDQDREAEGAFLRAMRLDPADESLLLDCARVLARRGKHAEVVRRLGGRVAKAADRHEMTRLLAESQLELGRAAEVIELLRPLLTQGAPNPRMRLLFARALLGSGEEEAGNAQLDRLLQMDPPPVGAVMVRARQQDASGDRTGAIASLRSIQRRHDLSHEQRQSAVALLADVLHRSGNYQAAWEQCLGLDQRTAEVILIRSEKPLQLVDNEAAETAMEREVAWSWPPQPPGDGRPEPVFVFAWPGAGRADVLRALAGHSGICVVDDPLESQSKRRLEISHPQGKGPLNGLTSAQIQLARRKFWKALQQLDTRAAKALTIDAMWLTAEALPTLYRLFPQSHLIVLEQDPRDMAVHWLRSGYRDLEGMAARYSQQIDLLERCRAGVPLNYIDIDAGRLQEDAGGVLREMVSGLSIAWEPAVEEAWRAGSPQTDVATAGSWEHYSPWLEPVFAGFDSADQKSRP